MVAFSQPTSRPLPTRLAFFPSASHASSPCSWDWRHSRRSWCWRWWGSWLIWRSWFTSREPLALLMVVKTIEWGCRISRARLLSKSRQTSSIYFWTYCYRRRCKWYWALIRLSGQSFTNSVFQRERLWSRRILCVCKRMRWGTTRLCGYSHCRHFLCRRAIQTFFSLLHSVDSCHFGWGHEHRRVAPRNLFQRCSKQESASSTGHSRAWRRGRRSW